MAKASPARASSANPSSETDEAPAAGGAGDLSPFVRDAIREKATRELAALDSDSALRRRLRHYASPTLLVIDEVGYLSYSNRHADLLFELISRRHEKKSTLITTNKSFAEWSEVFPNAACVVALIDRLVHHAEIIALKGPSWRHKEAQERAATNARKRLEGVAVRSDDKGGTVVDPGRLARLESTLGKMSPGWQHMSEPEQAKHLATAGASVNLLEGLNDRRNNSFWQSIGVDGSSASLDKLPIEAMKGGRLKTVKALEGAFTGGGVERNDYVIETGGGHKLYLPRDKVNQGELELLKSRGVDISSLQK